MKKLIKRLMVGFIVMAGLTFSVSTVQADDLQLGDVLPEDIQLNSTRTETYLNPKSFTEKQNVTKRITVSTNINNGRNSLKFNPGDGTGTKERLVSTTLSYTWSHYWKSYGDYNYWGQATNETYGPGPTVYGLANITY
ncbi:hypothetical protein [Ornithinibacillus sp. 179-J 7C1 HS]|uniref:hypothetical protein n=1 Tax=Ornithinibacillus sp. 179-J 7C1 HS TaxID=3142384 RepID=UPI0039A0F12F